MSYGGFQNDDAAAAGSAVKGDYAGVSSGPVAASHNLPVAHPVVGAQSAGSDFHDPEAQTSPASRESILTKSGAVKVLLFTAALFVLFIANFSVYGNANNASLRTACQDPIAYLCLVGVFLLFAVLYCILVVALWWRGDSTNGGAEPLTCGSSAVLRWTSGLMFAFWVIVFCVGFAATHWVYRYECPVKDVKGMATADIILGWGAMIATVVLIYKHRPGMASV